MVHDRPLLKVSRPVAACSKCRSAKIKCDGALPACSACTKQGKEADCTSTNDNFARGKERSYVSTLLTRLDILERKLAHVRNRPDDTLHDRPSPTTHVIESLSRRQEARDVDDIVSDFGYLTINATARDYYGFTAFFSYSRLILSACSSSLDPNAPIAPLPPRHLIFADVQHYLLHLYPRLPFFDEAALHYSLNAVYHTSRAVATHFDHWIVTMVLAISNASQSTHTSDQRYLDARAFAATAVKIHAAHFLQPGSITGIQAMLFLVHFALFDPLALDTWNLIGAASRLMIDLGLHQDSARPRLKLETQRRLYYCIYSLDRKCSIMHSRAFSFADETTNVHVPTNSPLTSGRDDWLRGLDDAIAILRLRQIQARSYRALFLSGEDPLPAADTYVWQCCRETREWFDALPSSTSASAALSLELEMLFSEIHVLRPSPRIPVQSTYARHVLYDRCVSYVFALQRQLASPDACATMTIHDAMAAFVVACEYIYVLDEILDSLLSGRTPEPLLTTVAAPPPPLTSEHPTTRCSTSRTCIDNFLSALDFLATRFNGAQWKTHIQDMSQTALSRLTSFEASAH